MAPSNTTTISVIDFRRQSMVLQWHALGGTWTAYDTPPTLVHGIALIRASQPNICVYGQAGRLRLQVGSNQFALSENSPRISCTAAWRASGFAGVSPSIRAPAAYCTATPTGPVSTMISFAGWRLKPRILTGAPRARGNGRRASPWRRCDPGLEIGGATRQRGSRPASSGSVRWRHRPDPKVPS